MPKITTADCINAINNWYAQTGTKIPGPFKRIKKFKDENGLWTRIFEHKDSGTILQIVETTKAAQISKLEELVGGNYYFSFCYDEDRGDDGLAFVVVEKEYFKNNHHMNSVHFKDTYPNIMPPEFDEVMESTFMVADGVSKIEARKKLLSLGFSENEEFTNLMSSDMDTSMTY